MRKPADYSGPQQRSERARRGWVTRQARYGLESPNGAWARLIPSGDCLLWPGRPGSNGYGKFLAGGKTSSAHRASYERFIGPIPDGLCVLHRCDVRLCVNPEHLFLGTLADNNADMQAKGRCAVGEQSGRRKHPERWPRGDAHHARKHPEVMARGERAGPAKLTEPEVRAIRHRRSTGESLSRLAHAFGVSEGTIGFIVKGKTWKHLL